MCDPVSLAVMLGTKVLSTHLQNKAADAVGDARAQVTENARRDLKKFRDNAAQSFQTSLGSATPDEIKRKNEEGKLKRERVYTENINRDELLPAAAGGSDAAKRAIIRALEDAVVNSKQTAVNRAGFEQFQDGIFSRDKTFGRSKQNIGQQASFSRGRSGVTDLEYLAAGNAGDKYANLAGIVDAVGTVGAAVPGFGAGQGWWGGLDPKTGITWNSGRVSPK